MGNYINASDLENRLTTAVLENLSGKTGTALTTFVSGVISRAEAFVNSYAVIRYQVPLPQDELISEWALRIAEYELYKRGPGTNVPEKIRDSYKECISLLNDLAQGKLRLASHPLPVSPEGKSFIVNSDNAEEPHFTAKAMRSF